MAAPGSLFESYNPEGALGGLFAPAYVAGYAPSNQAVQTWMETNRPISPSLIDELRLPEAYRLPVLLCSVEGLSQEEAARRLGWTPGSLKGRLERGRKRLHAWQRERNLLGGGGLDAVRRAGQS